MQLEKFVWTGVAIGAALCIGTAPISAKPGAVKPSSPKVTTHASSPKSTTHGSPKMTTQGPKTTTHASGPKSPKTTTHGQSAGHAPKTSTKGAAAQTTRTKTLGNPHTQPTDTTTNPGPTTGGNTSGGTTSGDTPTGENTGGTTTTEPTVTLNKAQQLLTKNANLQSKMMTRLGTQLPDGVTVIQAASGFKNLGQFVAAVNVSNNLGIPFADLKAKMTGMTVDGTPITSTNTAGPTETTVSTMSLGQAIQSLKGLDQTTATQTANTATTQANTEIETTTTTTTTTTAKGKSKKRR